MTDAVLSTTKLETLHGGSPKAQLSTTKTEVLHGGDPKARLSATRMEVLYRPLLRRRVTVVVNL